MTDEVKRIRQASRVGARNGRYEGLCEAIKLVSDQLPECNDIEFAAKLRQALDAAKEAGAERWFEALQAEFARGKE